MQQIALKDLDSPIADKIKASANAIWGHYNHPPEDMAVRNVINKRWKGKGWAVANPTILGSVTGLGIGVGFGALIGHPGAMVGLGIPGRLSGYAGHPGRLDANAAQIGTDQHERGRAACGHVHCLPLPNRSELYRGGLLPPRSKRKYLGRDRQGDIAVFEYSDGALPAYGRTVRTAEKSRWE